ncbi:efflux transporter periplasmic adaptor subunit [Stenomitos frigidus ULC18]|uniref:Efflux transporter periplasmic adaptor subunit n=2 Tax=Stenomitos TaxID=1844270 RepID=A0A2T1E576_9CYAN|nr:efflux transporter periplasmic adaptor subunit [Stenomitos frigidus ULC18]
MKGTLLVKQLVLSALALSLLGSCSQGEQAASAKKPPPVKVKVTTLESATVNDSAEYVANLVSRRSVSLKPRVEGQVTQISVKPGEAVAAGTPILLIDPRKQQATVGSASATVEVAIANSANARATLKSYEADLLQKQADLKLKQTQYKRYRELAAQGATSRDTLDQFANNLAASKAQVGVTRAQIQAQKAVIASNDRVVQQNQASTQEQAVELQYYNITAPFEGSVGDIPVKVGDFVDTSTQLVTITQNNPLEVNLAISVDRAPDVKPGTSVELLDAQGKVVGTSKVFFIASAVDSTNQSVLIKSLYNNTQNKLRASQFVRARVIWSKRPGLLIPTAAISRIAGQTFVFVAQPGEQPDKLVAKQRLVKLGNIEGNNYQVLDGLKPGEKIVTSGLLSLRDNAEIAPEA